MLRSAQKKDYFPLGFAVGLSQSLQYLSIAIIFHIRHREFILSTKLQKKTMNLRLASSYCTSSVAIATHHLDQIGSEIQDMARIMTTWRKWKFWFQSHDKGEPIKVEEAICKICRLKNKVPFKSAYARNLKRQQQYIKRFLDV